MATWIPDEAQRVLDAITVASLCMRCLGEQTAVTEADIETILATVSQTLTVTRRTAPCQRCRRTQEVFRLL